MICAIGELLIDFLQQGVNRYEYPVLSAMPGGAPANFLSAVTSEGVEACFIGKAGNDSFGHLLKSTLKSKGIDTEGLILSDDVFTTLAFVTLDESNDRSFSFARKPGADTCLTEDEIDFSIIDRCSVFHFGSLSFTDEPSRSTVEKCIKYAKGRNKIISYDPNLRLPLWKSSSAASETIKKGLYYADTVKLSEDEGEFLFSSSPEKTAEIILGEYRASLVFVTLGEKGCYYKNPLCEGFVSPAPKVKPVDTTGAGDIFGGTASALILKSGKHPSELTASGLRKIAQSACDKATLSTTVHGGMI